jgi:hypothetical protein
MLAMPASDLYIRTISTRRFFLRPESVSLLATGSGQAVTFRRQSRAVDTVVSQLVQNGVCAIFGEFPVGHQHFPSSRSGLLRRCFSWGLSDLPVSKYTVPSVGRASEYS